MGKTRKGARGKGEARVNYITIKLIRRGARGRRGKAINPIPTQAIIPR